MKSLAFLLVFAVFAALSSFAEPECDYKVEILVEDDEFEKEEFVWRMRATKVEGSSTNITGTAQIKDADGKIVKGYKPWTSDSISRQKTSSEYSPNLREGEEYKITAEIDVECHDTNKDNNVDSKKIKIKGEEEENIEDNEESEDKESLNDEIETGQTKITNEAAPETNAKVNIKADTDNIIQLKNKDTNNQKPQAASYAVKNPPLVYKSSNERAKELIMLFLLTLSILLNIILIWKR